MSTRQAITDALAANAVRHQTLDAEVQAARAERVALIVQAARTGLTGYRIAKLTGLSQTHIANILKEHPMTALDTAVATARDNAAAALLGWVNLRRNATVIERLEFDRWDDDGDINGVQILHDDQHGVVAFVWVQNPDLPGDPNEGTKITIALSALDLADEALESIRAAIDAGRD